MSNPGSTGRPAALRRPTPRGGIFVAVVAAMLAVGAWVWLRPGPVERSLAGRWVATSALDAMTLRLEAEVDRRGKARVRAAFTSRGRFDAADGRWTMTAEDGERLEGRYTLTGAGTVEIDGPFGPATWKRQRTPEGGGLMAGRWETDEHVDGIPWYSILNVTPDGTYRYASTTELDVTVRARDGAWSAVTSSGAGMDGTYEWTGDDRWTLTTGGATVEWTPR